MKYNLLRLAFFLFTFLLPLLPAQLNVTEIGTVSQRLIGSSLVSFVRGGGKSCVQSMDVDPSVAGGSEPLH